MAKLIQDIAVVVDEWRAARLNNLQAVYRIEALILKFQREEWKREH